jgi:hypothetical protein
MLQVRHEAFLREVTRWTTEYTIVAWRKHLEFQIVPFRMYVATECIE